MDLVRLNAKVYRSKTGVYTEIPVLLIVMCAEKTGGFNLVN